MTWARETKRDVKRTIILDADTNRRLTKLAARFEDNVSLAAREMIRQAVDEQGRLIVNRPE
jgi:predicted transcriptional regulator